MEQRITNFHNKIIIILGIIIFTFIAGQAMAANNKTDKVICRVETDRGILPAGGGHKM